MSLPGLGLPDFGSDSLNPMRSTEVFTTNLDDIYPGLRVSDKFHPPNDIYPDPSYQQIFGLQGQKINTSFFDNTLIPKTPL